MSINKTLPRFNRDEIDDVEWDIRVQLAACYRLIAHFGMTDLIYNHITASLPDQPGCFLINPFGLLYDEITASSLIKIDLEGTVLNPGSTEFGINPTGYVIHSAIHEAREDVGCVLHTHTRAGVAMSCIRSGVMALDQGSMRFYQRVSYHDYEGLALNSDEKESLVRDLGENNVLVLRNHGLLTCGRTVPSAFLLMQRLENACKIQLDVWASGQEIYPVSNEVRERTAELLDPKQAIEQVTHLQGNKEWKALLRMLDRKDESYKH